MMSKDSMSCSVISDEMLTVLNDHKYNAIRIFMPGIVRNPHEIDCCIDLQTTKEDDGGRQCQIGTKS